MENPAEKPPLDLVIAVINSLYHSDDNQERDKASAWLLSLISTVRELTHSAGFTHGGG